MGTDIHSIAQVCRDGSWVTVAISIDGDPRSYNTFAMLANEPRGLPADLKEPSHVDGDDDEEADDNDDDNSVLINKDHLVAAWDWYGNEVAIESEKASRVRYLKEDSSRMWLGDHSHSWCTLTELSTFVENVVKPYTVKLCGYVDGWERPALDASRLSEIVAALELVRTRCGVSADDVRFVFGFDN